MAKPRMTEGYYKARESAMAALIKVASEAEEVNHLVCGRLDMASRPQYGTVVVERRSADADLFHVRPLRRRRVYTLPLSTVAEMVVRAIVMAEVRAKRAEKKAKKSR